MSAPLPGEHERDRDEDVHWLPYDPELGFLFLLEREVTRRATAAQEARTRAGDEKAVPRPRVAGERPELPRWASPRRRGLRPIGGRVARRSLTLVALLCLIGASAYGAGHIFNVATSNPADPHQSEFVQVDQGRSGPDSFTLRLYLRGGELCRALVVADTESSRCSPPPAAGGLGVTSVVSPTRRYVYGVTGARVVRVRVRAGEQTSTVQTTPTVAAGGGARVLPPGSRWFLAVLRRPSGESDPRALVRGLGADGRALSPTVSDCAEAPEALGCSAG